MNPTSITPILTAGMSPVHIRLMARGMETLASGFPAWAASVRLSDEPGAEHVIHYLIYALNEQQNALASIRRLRAEFNGRYNRSHSDDEQREHIIAFCRELGATEGELAKDRKALDRWFGHDGLMDRFRKRFAEMDRHVCFILSRLGVIAAREMARAGEGEAPSLWRRIGLEKAVIPLLIHDGDNRVRVAAFTCLATVIRNMPAADRKESVSGSSLQLIYRCALEPAQDVWLQCAALDLLTCLSSSSLEKAIRKRLGEPASHPDDIFVRHRAVAILGDILAQMPQLWDLLPLVMKDQSDYVRQALPAAIRHEAGILEKIAREDPSPQVRAAALIAVLPPQVGGSLVEGGAGLILRVMEQEKDPFVLRVCLKVIGDGAGLLGGQNEETGLREWNHEVLPGIRRLHRESPHLEIRRRAAQTSELLWCLSDPARRALRSGLASELLLVKEGKGRTLPSSLTSPHDEITLGRVVSILSQEGFGCQLSRRGRSYRLIKGHQFRFSWWRLFYELRTPSPDKRQAFSHTVGRYFTGEIRTTSAIMAEVSPTKVPGEPLLIGEEGGWRPYLPLPDEFLSALKWFVSSSPARIITSEGITEIAPPRSMLTRVRSALTLTTRFPRYARLRNWQPDGRNLPGEYLEAMSQLGFAVRFTPHSGENEPADSSVSRFFPLALPFLDNDLVAKGRDYFVAVYENSLEDLGIFALLLLALFLGERLFMSRTSRRARRNIPLVIGGWGTRGKSGTERLKAALFNAAGFGVVSKTTGCEAMMLHSFPFDNLREMFIFRPYDKATIWEQHKVVELAESLGAEVMLWECMGLNPVNVKILQECWMRDDIATITNTFPDHEDIQGPAGINIPGVMTQFIPAKSTLITSEEQMLPILEEAAREACTGILSVGWLEAGLLPSDILQRFPYEEHPYNVALVLALADQVGLDRDFALKEMAEQVVPDIGVLKAYPVATLKGRRLQFINGMSANDRYGCLENWRRMGLGRHHPDDEPGTWVTTVVNNRADRVARSKVFAQIMVDDIRVDRHFLIGTNLHGLLGYVERALDDHLAGLSLWPEREGNAKPDPLAILRETAHRHHIPMTAEHLAARFRAMRGEDGDGSVILPEDPSQFNTTSIREQLVSSGCQYVDQIIHHLERDIRSYVEYRNLETSLSREAGEERQSLETEYRNLVRKWFMEKIVVIEDSHATGEQLIDRICSETPPNFTNRIMGLQNIKGTGLDFVYRWQAWDHCYAACEELTSENPARTSRALADLAAFQGFGCLCEHHVRETVKAVRPLPMFQSEHFHAELAIITSNLDTALKEVAASLTATRERTLLSRIIDMVEAFLDAGDSIRRRKTADLIYRDLVNERISRQRAAIELQELTRRQKGGWLEKYLVVRWKKLLPR